MPKFMLLLHATPQAIARMPPEEIGSAVRGFQEWMETLRAAGRYVVSDKLMDEGGKVVSRESGRATVTDGPYSETKEVLGGYLTVRAADYDEAAALARECPFLAWGKIVIRRTDPMGCGEE
jgi:hypothetical protein